MTHPPEHTDDNQLIRTAQRGDKAAFGQLVERYSDWLRRAALRIVRQPEIARELTQETLLQAYLSLDSLRESGRFRGWLQGILRNVCYSYLRRQKGDFLSFVELAGGALREESDRGAWESAGWEGEIDEREVFGSELDPYLLVETWERRRVVEQAIETLSAKNKIATRLFYYEQLSLQEIAQHLGVSVNVVKARLYQARKQLHLPLQTLVGSAAGTAVLSQTKQGEGFSQELSQGKSNMNKNMNKIDQTRVITLAESSSRIICLLDQSAKRVLLIWVGNHEGDLIASALEDVVPVRPTAYHLFVALLKTTQIQLEEVRIEAIKNNTFYAVIKLSQGKEQYELDARPSDAIELALLLNRPIYVAEEVMRQAGSDLPQPFDETAWLQSEAARLAAQYQQTNDLYKRLLGKPELLTLTAIEVVIHLHAEAKRLNHNYLGTEHLLLGMVYNPNTPIAKLLAGMGATQERVLEAVERMVGRGQAAASDEPAVVPRLAQVVTFAEEARDEAKQPQLSVEHLLTGMLREGEGMAVTILQSLGVDLVELKRQVGG